MQYKLLAVDLDGTLLNKFKKIEKVDLDAIKHFISLGGIVIVSTGRHYAACKKYVTQIEDYTGKPIPYVITLNGAEVYNDKGEVVFTDHISKDVVEGINKILKKNKIIYFCYPVAQSLEKQTPYANSRVIKFFSATRHAIAPIYSKEYYAGDVYKLNIMSLNSKKLTRVKHEILEHYKNKIVFFPHNSFFYEISPITINKGIGIAFVAKKLGIDLNHTAAIGDTSNDVDAFKTCKLSASVRTRNKAVRAQSSVHISTKHGAVASFIKNHVLQDKPFVKMVVTDLDGTFYTDLKKEVVDEVKHLINEVIPERIKYFCVCSGRSAADTYRAIEALGVKNNKNMFVVGVNGAAIWDVEHYKQIYATWLPHKHVKKLIHIYEQMRKENVDVGLVIHHYDKQKTKLAMQTNGEIIPKMYCMNRPLVVSKLRQISPYFFTKYNREENYHELKGCPSWLKASKIIFFFNDQKTRDEYYKRFVRLHLPLYISVSVGTNIEFNNASVNKSVGLKRLCKYLGIKPSETLVCGDEKNDMPMLKLTEWSYCFKHCKEDVMNACKYILDAQPSYMVGDAIKHYVKEHLDKKGKGNGN